MTKKVKVRFLVTRVVQDGLEGTDQETKFEAGKTYSLEPASAERWISRKVAELATSGRGRRNKSADAGDGDAGSDAAGDGDGDADTGDGDGDGDADTGDEDSAGEGGDLLGNADNQE